MLRLRPSVAFALRPSAVFKRRIFANAVNRLASCRSRSLLLSFLKRTASSSAVRPADGDDAPTKSVELLPSTSPSLIPARFPSLSPSFEPKSALFEALPLAPEATAYLPSRTYADPCECAELELAADADEGLSRSSRAVGLCSEPPALPGANRTVRPAEASESAACSRPAASPCQEHLDRLGSSPTHSINEKRGAHDSKQTHLQEHPDRTLHPFATRFAPLALDEPHPGRAERS
jgi:hypothetical protein